MKYFVRFFVASILLGFGSAHAAENVIIPKLGSFSLSETQQTTVGVNATYDEDSSGVFAVEYERRLDGGFSFGGEFVSYTNDYTSSSGSGEADVGVLTFNVKQYFNSSGSFMPFVGAGIGFGVASMSGPISGDAVDLALQIMGGFEYQFTDTIGIYAEYKVISSEPEDDAGETVDISGSGVFAGLTIHF